MLSIVFYCVTAMNELSQITHSINKLCKGCALDRDDRDVKVRRQQYL